MELELSSEVKTNSKVLIPLKAVYLKELIQEDTAEGQPHGECPLETDKVTEKFILKRCASIPFFFQNCYGLLTICVDILKMHFIYV